MKQIICFLLLLVPGLFAFSQTEQLSLAELKTEYFKQRTGFASSSTKKFTADEQAALDALVLRLQEKDAASFESNLVTWVNGNYNTKLEDKLFKAYALNGSDEITVREMLGYYIITANLAKQKEFVTKVQKFYTPAELAYYADAMPAEKSILITSNQEDMYGFLIAQASQGVGTNVQVMNLDFMKNTEYREMVANNCGITDVTFLGNEKAYMKTLLSGSSVKISISATVPQDYLGLVSDQTYLTGLCYQYGKIDQFTALNNFWKKVKTKDLTLISLTKSSETKLYGNYLPPLLTLFMMQPGDLVLKTSIQAIALKVGREEEVAEILKEIEGN